jgi:hypothetical protein
LQVTGGKLFGMREYIVASLILFCVPPISAQVVPAGWQVIKDARNACQIAVPADWQPFGDVRSAAVFQDSATALAVVTNQPKQTFSPLGENLIRVLNIPKDKLFENSATRVFYQDKTSEGASDMNGYSVSVPGKGGMCSARLTFLPSVGDALMRKIALSLGPVAPPATTGSN